MFAIVWPVDNVDEDPPRQVAERHFDIWSRSFAVAGIVVLIGWSALGLSGAVHLPALVWILGYVVCAAVGIAGTITCPYLVTVDDHGVRRSGIDGGFLRWSEIDDLWLLPSRQGHLVLVRRVDDRMREQHNTHPGGTRAIRSERIFVAASASPGSLIIQASQRARRAIESRYGQAARPNNSTGLRRGRAS